MAPTDVNGIITSCQLSKWGGLIAASTEHSLRAFLVVFSLRKTSLRIRFASSTVQTRVIGKFYKGEDRKSTRLVDRQRENVPRGKAGEERSFIADHIVPALIRQGMVVKKRVAHGEILGIEPRRNAELIDFRFEGKISSGIRKLLGDLPNL
jgi:hypothetical protein